MLREYCRLSKIDFDSIKDYRKYLLDDENNTYIFCFMFNHYRKRGYTKKEFAQIWLFGERNFLSGRYSYSFERKIFLE
jgi:hypothetical protein